jgi:hypothetical protein
MARRLVRQGGLARQDRADQAALDLGSLIQYLQPYLAIPTGDVRIITYGNDCGSSPAVNMLNTCCGRSQKPRQFFAIREQACSLLAPGAAVAGVR